MRYSVQPRDRIVVKGYGCLSFVKNIGENIGKNMNRNLSGKYSHKILDHPKQSVTKLLQKEQLKKTAEATGDLIGNKIANRIMTVSKNSQQNNLETVTNENDKEIPKERYISKEEGQEIIHELRLK